MDTHCSEIVPMSLIKLQQRHVSEAMLSLVQTYMNQNKPVNVTSQGTDYYFTRKCFRDAKNTTSKMENLGNTNLLILLSDV